MHIILLVLILCFFIFLYVLYYLAHEDFVIVRKGIPMDRIFNMAFLTSVVSLFFSRAVFVVTNPVSGYLTPLGFLAIPYLPGLSMIGGILSGAIFIYIFSDIKKMPAGKIFDLFCMSFISVAPLGYFGTFLILFGKTDLFFNIIFISTFLMLFLFAKIIYPFSLKGEIKDGSSGLIFLAVFSSILFLTKLFLDIKYFSFLDIENILLLVTLFSSLIILLNQEIMEKFLSKK